jgi:TonB family protein
MLPVAYYLLKVMICSGIMYCYYLLALRNKRFHQYNRFYLLFAVSLSFIIPFIKVEFWKETARQSAVMKAFTIVNYTDAYIAKQTLFIWDWESIAFTAFVFISFTFLLSLIVSLIKIFAIIKRHPKKFLDKVCFVFSDTPGSPFSFFKYIFWNREIDIESDTGKQMLKHELVHVHEKHSADKLFLNLMLVIGWYNPFIWLVRRELNMIHEFIADQKAVSDGEVNSLALMLLQSTYPSHSFMFVNSFFHSPIKRRLIMLTKTHHARFSYLSRLIILPLLAIVFALFAFKIKRSNSQQSFASTVKSYIVPAADASQDTSTNEPYSQIGIRTEGGKKVIYTKDKKGKMVLYSKEAAIKRFGFTEEDVDRWLSETSDKNIREEDSNVIRKYDKVFTRVENPPTYKGGTSFTDYIKTNLQYPTQAVNNKTGGKVVIKFIVDEDGKLTNFEPLTSLGNGLEEEAMRIIKTSSPWKPAIQNGRKVPFEVRQEIEFALGNQVAALENDEPATFPGGADAWRKYLEKNLNANVLAENHAPTGHYSVKLTFNVSKDGTISNVVAKTKNGYGTEEEAIRFIKEGPKWVPAKKDGSFVDSEVNQTITFMVAED